MLFSIRYYHSIDYRCVNVVSLFFPFFFFLSLFRTFLLGGDLVVFLTLPKILAIVISCYVIGMLRVFHTRVWLSLYKAQKSNDVIHCSVCGWNKISIHFLLAVHFPSFRFRFVCMDDDVSVSPRLTFPSRKFSIAHSVYDVLSLICSSAPLSKMCCAFAPMDRKCRALDAACTLE